MSITPFSLKVRLEIRFSRTLHWGWGRQHLERTFLLVSGQQYVQTRMRADWALGFLVDLNKVCWVSS